MADPVKRLRFFDGEFLRAADLKAEQDYHVGLRRGQNRTLWVAGIADGLDVIAGTGTSVVVKAGRAIDGQGRDLVLANDSPAVDLSGVASGSSVYITLSYDEQETDASTPPSAAGNTRVTEQPLIKTPGGLPASQVDELVLGRVTRTASGVTLDPNAPRRTLEPKALGPLRQDVASRLSTNGGTIASLSVSGTLGVTGQATMGNLKLSGQLVKGTNSPQRDFHFEAGEMHCGGAGAGYSFSDRGAAFNNGGGGGERWVLYSLNKSAHLWSGGDKLNVSANGDLGITGNFNAPGGALMSGVVVGRDGIGIDYPWEYETVGVSQNVFNLRLQSPNSVIVHAFGKERMWFDNRGNLSVQGSGSTDPAKLSVPSWSGGGLMAWDIFAAAWVYAEGIKAKVKQFSIDHPLDPDNRNLEHSTLEGPEVGVYYRGESRLEDGRAQIELPAYFEALTRQEGRSVLITPKLERGAGPIATLAASEVADGGFTVVAADGGDAGQPFFWEVKAVRSDLEALEVEPPKPGQHLRAVA